MVKMRPIKKFTAKKQPQIGQKRQTNFRRNIRGRK